jgi:formimidoylglutamate deiminase
MSDEEIDQFRYLAGREHEHTCFRARYILQGTQIREDAVLAVRDGVVTGLLEPGEAPEPVNDLGDVAIVPGRVNAHSHAFQRAIRGRTEYLAEGRTEDDFWSWREKMYRAALALDPEDFERVARFAFLEMLRAGFTTVGEFQYVHHDRDGNPYDDPNELSKRLIRAAEQVGLDATLLRAAYHRSGYQADPNPRQRRFREPDVETYLARTEQLLDFVDDRQGMEVGLAPHSIRAVPGSWFDPIAAFGEERELPIHIHAAEQTGELEVSRAEYGTTPIAALDELGLLSERLTVVHATHATEREIDLLADRGSSVCACPTTERNLGDGFLPARELVSRDVPICIGTDSHAQVDPWDEMRLVEYHERLRDRRRNVLAEHAEADGDSRGRETARVIWPMGGRHGARALGRSPCTLEPGDRANFVVLDRTDPALPGASASSLLYDRVF